MRIVRRATYRLSNHLFPYGLASSRLVLFEVAEEKILDNPVVVGIHTITGLNRRTIDPRREKTRGVERNDWSSLLQRDSTFCLEPSRTMGRK